LGAGAAGAAAGEGVFDAVEFAAGFGQCLAQPAGLAGVQLVGVGEHASVGQAEGFDGGLVGLQPVEGGDRAVGGAGDVQQVRAVGGGQRADVVELGFGELGEVGLGVLPGVEDDGQRVGLAAEGAVAAGQLVEDGAELGDVGLVARVGVGGQRDAAVAGDDQAEADQAQVEPFLLGLAPLGQRGARVGGVDERGEVGHVQREGGDVQAEGGDGAQRDPPLDLGQRLGAQPAGGVPVSAGVQCRGAGP
jgi:hypothetical protein